MNVEAAPRNTMLDAFTALLNSGKLRFRTSADNQVAQCVLNADAFQDAAAGAATANAVTSDTNTVAGTIDHCQLLQSDDTLVATLSVGATGSGEDIQLSSLTFAAGETLVVDSFVLNLPAS